MGLNNYPYSNFHEMNLDWILEQFQQEVSRIEALETFESEASADISELQTKEAQLRGYIIALQAAQSTLSNRQDEVESTVNGMNTRVSTLESTVSGITAWQTTTNATLIDYGNRLVTIEEFIDDIAEGELPQQLIDSLMQYVRDNLPELLNPLKDAIDELQTDMLTAQNNITALQGNKFNAGMGTTSEADLNNIITAGIYRIDSNYTTVNVPVLSYGILTVERTTGLNDGTIEQIFTADSNNKTYTRVYHNNTWYPWMELGLKTEIDSVQSNLTTLSGNVTTLANRVQPISLGGTGASTLVNAMNNLNVALAPANNTIPEGADLNNDSYWQTGIWRNVTASTNITNNIPKPFSGKLLCLQISSEQYAKQIFIPNDNLGQTYYWERIRSGNSIGDWQIKGSCVSIMRYNAVNDSPIGGKGQFSVHDRVFLTGYSFMTYSTSTSTKYITVPKGVYKISYNINTDPGTDGVNRAWLSYSNTSTTPSNTPTAASSGASSVSCGNNSSICTLHGEDIQTFSEDTRIALNYYNVNHTSSFTGPGTYPYMMIEKIV